MDNTDNIDNVARLSSRAQYLDLNKFFGGAGNPDLLYDKSAISQGLHNIFSTTPGEAGPIFEPEFGSLLPLLLQEPMDEITSEKIRLATIQAVQRWEPRVDVDFQNTRIDIDLVNQAYLITLAYIIRFSGEPARARIRVSNAPDTSTQYDSIHDYSIALHLEGWPGAYKFCSTVGAFLVWNSASDTGDGETWPDFTPYLNAGEKYFSYIATLDRKIARNRTLNINVQAVLTETNVIVEVATSTNGTTYSAWQPSTTSTGTARFYKVRITAHGNQIPELSFAAISMYY